MTDDKTVERTGTTQKFLLFDLAGEVYGIDIVHVVEIVAIRKITRVPDLPPHLRGIINLRGRVVAVMDLRMRFGMPERAYDERTCIIVLNHDDISTGFIVDTVADVRDVASEDLEPPPTLRSTEEQNRYVKGLAKIGDEVKIILDVNRILLDEDIRTIRDNLQSKGTRGALNG
jgi:purine-binding chemotaxis protein CheW